MLRPFSCVPSMIKLLAQPVMTGLTSCVTLITTWQPDLAHAGARKSMEGAYGNAIQLSCQRAIPSA